jgi:hypothetical protein
MSGRTPFEPVKVFAPMHNLIPFVIALGALVACSPKQEAQEDAAAQSTMTAPTADTQTPTHLPSKALDLSMPENFFLEDTGPTAAPLPNKFDASGLFEEDDKTRIAVTVSPSFTAGEDELDLPEIDGGSIAIKVKTK